MKGDRHPKELLTEFAQEGIQVCGSRVIVKSLYGGKVVARISKTLAFGNSRLSVQGFNHLGPGLSYELHDEDRQKPFGSHDGQMGHKNDSSRGGKCIAS